MPDAADIVWLVIVVAIIVAFLAPTHGDPMNDIKAELWRDHSKHGESADGEPSAEERTVAEAWMLEHFRRDCPLLTVSSIRYTFDRHNGIGVGVTARCQCGASQDVTDYATW